MGHQIRLFMGPSDVREWASAVEKKFDVSWLQLMGPSSSAPPPADPVLTLREMGKANLTIGLAPRGSEALLTYRKVAGDGRRIDILRSPIIEFERSYIGNAIVRAGRLFYDDGFYDGAAWNDKPTEFRDWAKAVLGLTRRSLHRDARNDAYVGKEVELLREREAFKLVMI
jgi:hypothetical protein